MEKRLIKNYPKYQICSNGDILSLVRKEKKMKPVISHKGYYRVMLYNESKKRTHYSVHRLVALAFLPNPEKKPEVNHKNGIKTDNRAENLEWVTSSENVQHFYKLGGKNPNLGKFGKDNHGSKKIEQFKDGKLIKTWHGIREASRGCDISFQAISACLRKITRTSGGFEWRYKKKANPSAC